MNIFNAASQIAMLLFTIIIRNTVHIAVVYDGDVKPKLDASPYSWGRPQKVVGENECAASSFLYLNLCVRSSAKCESVGAQ